MSSATHSPQAVTPLAVDPHQQERAVVDAAEAGFEEPDERQAEHAELEALDDHAAILPAPCLARGGGRYTRGRVDYRYLAIEGPVGVGKTALAERLAVRLDATAILEDADNPFLADFYQDKPGAAFQTQLFFLLSRHRQLSGLRQTELFSQVTICDYLFDRDRIYAYLSLDDNELFIYQRLYELLARDIPPPDLVVYLQAPTDLLLKRLRERARDPEQQAQRLDPAYVKELNEAYQHFFFHYTTTPLLVVETSQIDFGRSDDAVDELIRQTPRHGPGDAVLRAAEVARQKTEARFSQKYRRATRMHEGFTPRPTGKASATGY